MSFSRGAQVGPAQCLPCRVNRAIEARAAFRRPLLVGTDPGTSPALPEACEPSLLPGEVVPISLVCAVHFASEPHFPPPLVQRKLSSSQEFRVKELPTKETLLSEVPMRQRGGWSLVKGHQLGGEKGQECKYHPQCLPAL